MKMSLYICTVICYIIAFYSMDNLYFNFAPGMFALYYLLGLGSLTLAFIYEK